MSSGAPRRSGRGRGRFNGQQRNASSAGQQQRTPATTRGNRRGGRQQQRGRRREEETALPSMRDEDVLIAFMPYLKGDHEEATRIHEEYQYSNDQRAFLKEARAFLEREQQSLDAPTEFEPSVRESQPFPSPASPTLAPAAGGGGAAAAGSAPTAATIPIAPPPPETSLPTGLSPNQPPARPDPPGMMRQHHEGPPTPSRVEQVHQPSAALPTGSSPLPYSTLPAGSSPLATSSVATPTTDLNIGEGISRMSFARDNDRTLLPTNAAPVASSIWGSPGTPTAPPGQSGAVGAITPWDTGPREPSLLLQPRLSSTTPEPSQRAPGQPAPTAMQSPPVASPEAKQRPTPPSTKKEGPPPKRLWTHFHEQPGRITVNGVSGEDLTLKLDMNPREELMAQWILPVSYVQRKIAELDGKRWDPSSSLDLALNGLTVGLFRRGCSENGGQASIISKDARTYDYWYDPGSQSIRGKVPFYSPRTPGNVMFRMYWEKEPLYTLAMGPTLRVRVLEPDFESSMRFILSNFKGRKTNPTSLSSLHSLAAVLETVLTRRYDGRASWGCIQEARKVIDACHAEYVRTSAKMANLEEQVAKLKKLVEDEETMSQELSADDVDSADDVGALSDSNAALREKTRALISGRASSERKWRDSQLAFASILKALLTNPSMGHLLGRDLLTRMRIEFELWCPLSEEFAIPSEKAKRWYDALNDLPQQITTEDFRMFAQARIKMQMRTLGFEVNTTALEDILFPRNRGSPNQRTMDPGAVNVFNSMSAAMGQYYQELYVNEDKVVRQRELIRSQTEKCVQECGSFPPGTKVVIFGSSANGFGSPKSDIDMCLQLPSGNQLKDEEGISAMATLAEYFEKVGMKEVDSARLTARIPIVKYECPDPLPSGDVESLIECDLSMHNPLAVLNTSLLRSYAEITPVTRVIASIIKRWAKARDINSPERHTLSSYGYTIMLLHFLTYHCRTGNGLVSLLAPPEGSPQALNQRSQQPTPILPNLQWMDPMWLSFPKGTPYRELPSLPQNIMKHPMKEDTTVNAYFYRSNTPNEKTVLQMLFPGQDLSLAILLASFFRYYAYEFDYKRHVVSLHSTASRGVVERELKAELDGWRNYSAALAIEDPFELEYDIAHVLRGGNYHRIRREFALAYTKIADAASGRQGSWNKGDLRSMTGPEIIDWICEPVVLTEKEQPAT